MSNKSKKIISPVFIFGVALA